MVERRRPKNHRDLVAAVVAAGGVVTLDRSEWGSIHDFYRAVRIAQRYGVVPDGNRLRYELGLHPAVEVRLEEVPGTNVPLRPVPVPHGIFRYHPVTKHFSDRETRGSVSRVVMPRAARIVQALAVEAELRGYQPSGGQHGHLVITVKGTSYEFRLLEDGAKWERDKRTGKPLGAYPLSGSGRLRLEMVRSYRREGRPTHWADGRASSLEDRLPEVLREPEIRDAEDEFAKLQAEREAAERRRRWEAVMEQARAKLIERHRAMTLQDQADRWLRMKQLTEYLDEIAERVIDMTDPGEAAAAREWLGWGRRYVESLNPLAGRIALPEPPRPRPRR